MKKGFSLIMGMFLMTLFISSYACAVPHYENDSGTHYELLKEPLSIFMVVPGFILDIPLTAYLVPFEIGKLYIDASEFKATSSIALNSSPPAKQIIARCRNYECLC